MSLEELKKKLNRDWPTIDKSRADAEVQVRKLDKMLADAAEDRGSLVSQDISLVVFGSLARSEWTSGSDLDWTLLIDGGADHEHANTAHQVSLLLEREGFGKPGPTGTFGNLTFSHTIIHQIGGSDDSNHNTTQRLLLLLESKVVNHHEAYDRVILGILRRYLQNDFRNFRLKVPRFLLNDLHRYWRTMCVDYASKYRERASEGWAIRNIKLRMSRKLIFAAGLVMCYSCDPEMFHQQNPTIGDVPKVEEMVDHLRQHFVEQTPLDILCGAINLWAKPETASDILNAYEAFLSRLDNADDRNHLKLLSPDKSANDNLFQDLQRHTRSFEKGLERFFFDDDPTLAALNREYGVF